jgi:hypothetical protein
MEDGMRARWALAAFGVGALLGAASVPGWLLLDRHRRVKHATDTVGQAVSAAVATERADPGVGLGQGGMSFGVYEPGPFGLEDYTEHMARSFPRLWCPYCYGSGCAKCHHIGEVAP